MKSNMKIVLYIVSGFCFCIFCISGCCYLTDESDTVKIKRLELSIIKEKNEMILDSLNINFEKDLKMELIKKGKEVSPRKGYEKN